MWYNTVKWKIICCRTFCSQEAFLACVSVYTQLQFPLLLQLKSMEIKHVGGKQTSIKVSQCVFSSRICFTPQLTVLAVRAWITRTTAVFPPDTGEHIRFFHYADQPFKWFYLMRPIAAFVDTGFDKCLCCHLTSWDWKRLSVFLHNGIPICTQLKFMTAGVGLSCIFEGCWLLKFCYFERGVFSAEFSSDYNVKV